MPSAALYRSKPQEVEAIQWTGDNRDALAPMAASDRYQTRHITATSVRIEWGKL